MSPDNNPESKFRENLRYLGYTIGIFGGAILTGLVWLFIEPILAFIWSFIFLIIILILISSVILTAVYLIFFKEKE